MEETVTLKEHLKAQMILEKDFIDKRNEIFTFITEFLNSNTEVRVKEMDGYVRFNDHLMTLNPSEEIIDKYKELYQLYLDVSNPFLGFIKKIQEFAQETDDVNFNRLKELKEKYDSL